MPRFLVLIKELGKAPRVVPLTSPLLVGRSRRADIVVDDDEVGREQFRLLPLGSGIELEGIGQTNRTMVDGTQVAAGQRKPLVAGATIKVGKTTFVVQVGDSTEAPPAQPGNIEATLVAPRPKPGDGLSEQEQTGGASSPMGTMQMKHPGAAASAPTSVQPQGNVPEDAGFGATMPPKAYRPGAPAPSAPSAPSGPNPPKQPPSPPASAKVPADDDLGNMTMPPKAYRPGAPSSSGSPPPTPKPPPTPPAADAPKPKPPAPAADDAMANLTMPPKAYRPGKVEPPTESTPSLPGGRPSAASGPAPAGQGAAAQPPAPKPTPAPPQPPAPAPAPAPAPRPVGAKPTTVLVRPSELPPAALANGLSPAELEGRLHASLPRLLVKGEGMKRRIRLMKQRSRIGRAETADVLLPHETVSEQHAELQFDGTRWSLIDSGSANGTLVDGSLVRAAEQPIERNTLLGFGNLRAIFLCNCSDSGSAKDQRAHEQRAVQFLVAKGRLGREIGKQLQQLVRADQSQSLGEVLLMETPLEPADWQLAIAATRDQLGMFARIRRYFARLRGSAPKR